MVPTITTTVTITTTMAKNITTNMNIFTTMATAITKKHDYNYNAVVKIRKIKQKFNSHFLFKNRCFCSLLRLLNC